MTRAWLLGALVLAIACEGLGRPVVGTRPIVDAGEDELCELTPACVPLRTAPTGAFVVPPSRLVPEVFDDCDEDGVEDAMDACPGVPASEPESACLSARADCARLAGGASDLDGADLRGCRIDAPLALAETLSLRGADLRCASLVLVAGESAQPRPLDATQVNLGRASITLEAPFGPLVLDASRAQLRRAFVRLRGGARMRASDSIFSDARLVIEPGGGGVSAPSPALEIMLSDVETSSFVELPSAWPGRTRIERSSVRESTFGVEVLELVETDVVRSNVGAAELLALGADLSRSTVSSIYASFSACHLRDVIFARCVDLAIRSSLVEDADVPACEPERFRVVDSELLGARLGGGLTLVDSSLGSSILGSGPRSFVRTVGSNLDAVTICDLGAAAFYDGELRCVRCAEDAFMGGTSVCVAGSRLFERGCPAIELAPSCP